MSSCRKVCRGSKPPAGCAGPDLAEIHPYLPVADRLHVDVDRDPVGLGRRRGPRAVVESVVDLPLVEPCRRNVEPALRPRTGGAAQSPQIVAVQVDIVDLAETIARVAAEAIDVPGPDDELGLHQQIAVVPAVLAEA